MGYKWASFTVQATWKSMKMTIRWKWWWIRWAYLYPILGLLRYHPLGDRKVCCGFPDDLPCMRGQPALLSDAKCFYQDPIPNCAHYYLSMNSIQPKLDSKTHLSILNEWIQTFLVGAFLVATPTHAWVPRWFETHLISHMWIPPR